MDDPAEDGPMFVCDCSSCGRRELRGPRSLHPLPVGDGIDWIAHCRRCGEAVTIVASRPRRGTATTSAGPAGPPKTTQAA